MKAFFTIFVIVALAVGAYLYRGPIQQALGVQLFPPPQERPLPEPPPGTTRITSHPSDGPTADPQGTATATGDTTRAGAGNTGGTTRPNTGDNPTTPGTTGTPATAGGDTTPETGGVGSNDEFAEQFPMPEFRPLEEIVGDWQAIPASAFPREITLGTGVTMTLGDGIGESTAPAGTKVTALSIDGSTLTVAPNRSSPVRGSVDIDDTDLKDVLTSVYENFKKRRINAVLAKRDQARRQKMAAVLAQRAAKAATTNLLGPKPEKAANGTVPAMVASIQARDVTEFNLSDIKAWGPVLYDEIDDQPYWTGTVSYDAETIFGTFPAEAMALIRQGKVIQWIYSGSHEPVP